MFLMFSISSLKANVKTENNVKYDYKNQMLKIAKIE